jgi:formylglycine-generating enzyme required for sulfatase activity/tRNA A-37 threonylcarbamoyl transferase component Bud32
MSSDKQPPVPPAEPQPAPIPAIPVEPRTGEGWRGDEQTLLVVVDQKDPLLIPAQPSGSGGEWSGGERTLVDAPVPAAAPAGAELWTGSERTLVGGPAPSVPAPAATPVSDEWTGGERTVVGTPASAAAAEAWTGDERTLVGAPSPVLKAPGGGEDWTGNEATLLGVPAGAKPVDRREGGTSHGATPSKTGSRPTAPTMDDAWHLKGRQGALTGKSLADYEIGGILGEGGMGTVYRGRQISLKRRVAVKVLPPNLAADLRLRERFEQEARTASLLQSPHVVQVYGAGQQDDIIYFVMEYVEGTDLSAVIHEKKERGEKFTAEEAAGYIIQAARGLAEASKHNVVHRDIKPANLMITSKGVVKVADFGISKVAGEHGLTMTGTTVGTPAYCSPEQGRGDPVDPRADLYSLGVVFYELLTGQKPFEGATANALIYQHNYAEPKLPKEVEPTVGDAYQAVCLKCLMKSPDQRYGDAAELVGDLERIRDGSMSLTAVFQAKFGTGADEAMIRMGLKRRYGWWPLVAAAVLLVVAGGAGLWWWGKSAERQQIQASRDNEIARYRKGLAELDRAQAIPPNAATDLKWWADNKAKDDDWKRWTAKVERVGERREALAALLDGGEELAAEPRARAATELEGHRADVGDQDADVQRWQARLQEQDRRIAGLRGELKALFAAPVLTTQLKGQASAPLARFTRLAGGKDPDAVLWNGRTKELDAQLAELAGRLGELDKGQVRERRAAELNNDLTAFAALAGSDDARADGWRRAIEAVRKRVADLREALGRIGRPEEVKILSEGQQQAVGALLDDYKPLVEANDGLVQGWERTIARGKEQIERLRERLKRLDEPKALNQVELQELARPLDDYRALVLASDKQLAAWSARMRKDQDEQARFLAVVDKYMETRELAAIQARTAAAAALMALDERGAVAVDRKAAVQRRIADEEAEERRLRDYLKEREEVAEAAADPGVTTAFDTLARIAGAQDADVLRWSVKLKRYKELSAALAPLDQIAAIPERADENLVAFIEVVGAGNNKAKEWQAKLERVTALRTALAPLDQVGPMPLKALDQAEELVARWVGEQDPQAKRWRDKARLVTRLRTDLGGLFARDALSNYVLADPEAARRQIDQLAGQVGGAEPDVRLWDWRERTLRGPGRPPWAEAAERDAYGIWADLKVGRAQVRMRWIPAGVFALGTPEGEPGRDSDEVRIDGVVVSRGFWLCDSECTQEFWQEVMGSNPSRFIDEASGDRPVERVSWNDTRTFSERLTARLQTDRQLAIEPRLPSEAEWEYACRAGSDKPFQGADGAVDGQDPQQLAAIAWSGLKDGTRGVRRRAPNRLGLFDMHGNVWEWCRDKYGTYSAVEVVDPEGRQEEARVIRGGSWADASVRLRAGNRHAAPAGLRTLYLGFRFALKADWPDGKEPQRPGAGL